MAERVIFKLSSKKELPMSEPKLWMTPGAGGMGEGEGGGGGGGGGGGVEGPGERGVI